MHNEEKEFCFEIWCLSQPSWTKPRQGNLYIKLQCTMSCIMIIILYKINRIEGNFKLYACTIIYLLENVNNMYCGYFKRPHNQLASCSWKWSTRKSIETCVEFLFLEIVLWYNVQCPVLIFTGSRKWWYYGMLCIVKLTLCPVNKWIVVYTYLNLIKLIDAM